MGFMDSQVLVALALSMIGGLSTSIGALVVVMNKAPNLKMLGLLQGFAAGLMLSISFFDLAHNAINSIGFLKGNLWFFGGVVFFAIIANFIPEPALAPVPESKSKKKMGDAGGKDTMKKHQRQVLFSGIITAVGISLHNFPEGMAVFLGSIKGLRVGLNLALAIALHNIPEGVAVALPVYFATRSKWQAFKLATLSGLAEPLGVIIVAYLFPSSLSPEILEGLLGAVGGVMAFLTLHEMLPLAFDYAGQKHAVKAVFIGMAFMSARKLRRLEICAPVLESFCYSGLRTNVVYTSVPKLVQLSINFPCGDFLSELGYGISSILTQIEVLSLDAYNQIRFLRIVEGSMFTRLKKLDVHASPNSNDNLYCIISLIHSCPSLQHFKLKLVMPLFRRNKLIKWEGNPHNLKNVSTVGFVGQAIDLEFSVYLMEKAVSLDKMIVDTRKIYSSRNDLEITRSRRLARARAEQLREYYKPGTQLEIL